jgi:pimeloyl-ACP methyl ester carboxylesterase
MILSIFLVFAVISIITFSLIIKFKEDPFSFLYSFRRTYSKRNPAKEFGVEVYDIVVPRIKSTNPKSVIKGWFIPYVPKEGESGVVPTIIATHGFSQNRDYLVPLIENFQKNKCHCVLYDGHSHGSSSDVGVVSGRKFSQDIQSIVDFACLGFVGQIPENRAALVDSNVIGLVGFSLGAVGSLHAACMITILPSKNTCWVGHRSSL